MRFFFALFGYTYWVDMFYFCFIVEMVFCIYERISTMSEKHHFSDEQKAELLSNPYTARVSNCQVTFNLAFKQLVIDNIDKPGMTAAKVFDIAGYSKELFTPPVRRYIVNCIRREAASPEGLKEPKPVKEHTPRRKHSETEFKELKERVSILEQQVNFLKKSQMLKSKNHSKPPTNSG